MNKKKVLILITKANWGGAQRYVFDISNNLPKDQFDVEVMSGSYGELIDRLKEAGIKAYSDLSLGRDIDLMSDISGFFDLLKILKEKKPDINMSPIFVDQLHEYVKNNKITIPQIGRAHV